jgi:hypothetical protein
MMFSLTGYTRPDENGEWKAPEVTLIELRFRESIVPGIAPSWFEPNHSNVSPWFRHRQPLPYLQEISSFDRSSLFEVYPNRIWVHRWNGAIPWYTTGSVFYYDHESLATHILQEQYPVITSESTQAELDDFYRNNPDVMNTPASRSSRESIMSGHRLTTYSIMYSFFICQELPMVNIDDHTQYCSHCRLLSHRLERYIKAKHYYHDIHPTKKAT